MLDELERAKLHPDVLRNLAKNKQLKKAEAYSENNPPPYPVTSVNGQIGDVTVSGISALDVYPVGSIYMSVNSTNPGTLFGGTWEQLEDRFLLAAGATYSAGSTGGSATMAHTHSTGNHTLTVAEMPSHSHKYTDYYNVSKGSGYKCVAFDLNEDPTGLSVQATGGNGAHNHGNTGVASNDDNMPPYLAVYMWKRTA